MMEIVIAQLHEQGKASRESCGDHWRQSGIGLATAQRFVNEGAYVFVTGRRQSELDAAVNKIGHNVTGVQGDVSKLADLDRLYATVKKEKGILDIVFANAGTSAFGPIGQITEEDFDKQCDVNVKGLLFTVQKALQLLQDGGSIVLNVSIVSISGLPALSVYSSTKAAVRSFARTWAVDLRERKIRVNAISPGVVPTPGYNTALGMNQEAVDQFVNASVVNIPLGRPGTTDEIAKAVSFLASDDSSYVNGIELFCRWGVGPDLAHFQTPLMDWLAHRHADHAALDRAKQSGLTKGPEQQIPFRNQEKPDPGGEHRQRMNVSGLRCFIRGEGSR